MRSKNGFDARVEFLGGKKAVEMSDMTFFKPDFFRTAP